MEKLFLLAVLAAVFFPLREIRAQDSASPYVRWEFSGAGTRNGETLISLKGIPQPGWKIFSVTMPEDLPNSRILLDGPDSAGILGITEKGKLLALKSKLFDNATLKYFEDQVEWVVRIAPGADRKAFSGTISFMVIRGNEVEGPQTVPFRFSLDASGRATRLAAGLQESVVSAQALRRNAIDLKHPVNTCGGTGTEGGSSKGLWNIFVLGFLGGLIALLTPCVFPMIPLTVSFFTKQSADRKKGLGNALLYGFFIVLIYALLSLPFYFLDSVNPEILNNISTNVWLNLFFFAVFVVFALSFFGLFEIGLPAGIANSVNRRAGIRGWAGIFFMALTLALVSFSCTGPILGSLLAGSLTTNGGAVQLSAGMTGFGLALALPFALFALFPGWLHSIPRSGSWLNSVKIVLGFLEIALAVKFLSNADLVSHWGILRRETFFAVWIITGICLLLYLWGILKFKHDPPPARLGPFRILLSLVFLAFVIYLLPGLTHSRFANRELISGFPPPLSYSLYGPGSAKTVEARVVNDYGAALALARKEGKPLLIDFTGWACVNCRKMEENVWIRPGVRELIENKFVLVSLYVDDRKSLPEGEAFLYPTREGSRKSIRTVGDKFATFQSENFENASQPLYVLLSPEEKLLNFPVGYTPDPKEYASWLQCGLEAFSKIHGPK